MKKVNSRYYNVNTRKKSAKGTPYAIVKFSDKKTEFELFLFAEILVANREKLKESSHLF